MKWKSLASPIQIENESHSIQFDPLELLDATVAAVAAVAAAASHSFAVANVVATSCA